MTVHNEAKIGEIAKIVLMPGDPLRAEYIANKFLSNVKLVNKVRNCFAFTGKYKDIDVTIMASGMGMPSISIYSYELFKFYDVDYIIRIGTAGSIDENLNLYDTVLVKEAFSQSNIALLTSGNKSNVIASSNKLNDVIINKANENNTKLSKITVNTSDVFYGETNFELLKKYNCKAIEMESFALFNNANLLNKDATTILTISDSIVKKEETTSEERQTAFNDMITLALESAVDVMKGKYGIQKD